MSAYGQLVERCARELFLDRYPDSSWTRLHDMSKNDYCGHARAILAEVLRTLEAVTPEMEEAGLSTSYGLNTVEALSKDWTAMLRASPLAPDQDKKS